MRTWTTQTTVAGLPDEVLALLTELDTERLVAGSRARVRGALQTAINRINAALAA